MAFDHVTLPVGDLAASRAFYTEALGRPPGYEADGLAEWDDFALILRSHGNPATTRAHLALAGAAAGRGPDGNNIEAVCHNR